MRHGTLTLAAWTAPSHWRTRPAYEKGDDLRRLWATGAATLLYLAIGGMPALAQETEEEPEETPATEEEKAIKDALERQPFAGEITVTSRR